MKKPLPVVFLAILSALSPCLGVPETLELADGRKLEQVTAATVEGGKVKVVHSGGVGRIAPQDFTADSRKALGLAGGENYPAPVPEITRLETTKGEVYEDIRSVRVSPVAVSFTHRDGAASVRFDELAEETRARFHYDPAAAADYEAKQAAENAAAEKAFEAEMGKITDAEKRKKAAYHYLATYCYKDDSFLKERYIKAGEKAAIARLTKAGYTPHGAEMALAELKRNAAAKKAYVDPAFRDTPESIREQLRSSPGGFQKRSKIKNTNGGG